MWSSTFGIKVMNFSVFSDVHKAEETASGVSGVALLSEEAAQLQSAERKQMVIIRK